MNLKKGQIPLFTSAVLALIVILLLWIVELLEWGLIVDLSFLGVRPRSWEGLIGIITGPFVHGDLFHLLSNSFSLFVLLTGFIFLYPYFPHKLIGIIYLLTNIFVWVGARDAYHIGASGIIYGLLGVMLFSGIFRKDIRSLAIALAMLFLYGGMLQGIFPGDPHISWEAHAFGAFSGAVTAFAYRKHQLSPDDKSEITSDDEEADDPEEKTGTNSTHEGSETFQYVFKPKDFNDDH